MSLFEKFIIRFSKQKLTLLIVDFVLITCGTLLALGLSEYPSTYVIINPFKEEAKLVLYITAIFFTLFIFRYLNLYKHRYYATKVDQIIQIIKAIFYSSIYLMIITYFLKIETIHSYSRTSVVLFIIFNSFLVIVGRIVFEKKFLLLLNSKNSVFQRRILAIGAGKLGQKLADEVQIANNYFQNLIGFLDDDESKIGNYINNVRILGKTTDLERIAEEYQVDEIYITIEDTSYNRILELIEYAKITNKQVNLVSSHYKVIEREYDTYEFNKLKSVPIFSQISPFYKMYLKRMFDIFITSTMMIVLSPLFIIISAAIKFSSKGPVFYKAEVVGKDGETFYWYKFRSMKTNSSGNSHQKHLETIIKENKSTEKIQQDPRITNIGRILRKYSLDELPQLINVLTGQMSLVGPRPCLPYEFEIMDNWQKRRTKVLPGVTGLWQIRGRNRKDVKFSESIVLDLYYADNISFWFDVKILLATVPAVIYGRGGS